MDMEVSSESCLPHENSRRVTHHTLQHTSAVTLINGTAGMLNASSTKDTTETSSASEDEGGGGKLKRSCSAPMINQLLPQARVSAPPTPTPPRPDIAPETGTLQPRARRFSASFGPVSPMSPGITPAGHATTSTITTATTTTTSSSGGSGGGRACSRMRVCQLREEEGMDIVNREAAHEREVQSSLQMARSLSQSCEDLAIDEDKPKKESRSRMDYSDPLHLNIGLAAASLSPAPSPCAGSASPTRPGRQCFSPSLQQCVRSSLFTPSPSKRPSAFMARRSLSPITPRSSPHRTVPSTATTAAKRKCDEMGDEFATPSKRLSVGGSGHEGGLLMTQPPHSLDNSCVSSAALAHTDIASTIKPSSALPQHFSSTFSSFKQFSPHAASLFPCQHLKDTSSIHSLPPTLGLGPFSNKTDLQSYSSSFEQFSCQSMEHLPPLSTYSRTTHPLSGHDPSASFHSSSYAKNPFCVAPSIALSNPFLAHNTGACRARESSENLFPPSGGGSAGRCSSPFQGGVATTVANNPFLRTGETRTVNDSSSTLTPTSHNSPHLFRPVSPAAVSGSPVTAGRDAILPSLAAATAMITDDLAEDDKHHARPVVPEPSTVAVATLRHSAAVTAVTPSSIPLMDRHRCSLDSNKSYQDMELSEDGSTAAAPVDM